MRLTIAVLALILAACATMSAQDTKQPVTALNWIAGCWQTGQNGRVTTESWSKPTENLMIGTSQTVRGSKSVSFEFLRVINNGEGLAYVALPSSAQSPTTFTAVKVSANEVVFENLKHDFPQRIIYKQPAPDKLAARIEGMANGQMRGMDFPMVRIKCE